VPTLCTFGSHYLAALITRLLLCLAVTYEMQLILSADVVRMFTMGGYPDELSGSGQICSTQQHTEAFNALFIVYHTISIWVVMQTYTVKVGRVCKKLT